MQKSTSDGGQDRTSLIYAIGRVNQGIRREMRARLAPWQLSVSEYTVLSVLASRPGLSNAQLARRALVAPQSMIEILAKLESRELVERRVDPHHMRILRSRLTRKGAALLAEAEPLILSIQEQLLADVPVKQRELVVRGIVSAMNKLTREMH